MRNRVVQIIAIVLFTVAAVSLPARADALTELSGRIISETAVLIDGDTGQVLFDKDMSRRMYPASITKVMTALLALERGSLYDEVIMTYDAVFTVGRDTSHIALDVGEVLPVGEAMYALAIASANDAANGIAEYIGGTMDGFAAMMNSRAREAGALDTHFTNAHGLFNEEHYTTAYDMARIMAAAIRVPEFCRIFSTTYHEMPPTNKQPETRYFWNKNAMLAGDYKYDGIIAGKTGWIPESGHTLVTAANRDGRMLVAVVMGSQNASDKWKDTTALFDYGFGEFISVGFTAGELGFEQYPAEAGAYIDLYSDKGFTCLVPKQFTRENVRLSYDIIYDDAGQATGAKAVFTLDTDASVLMGRGLGESELRIDYPGNGTEADLSTADIGRPARNEASAAGTGKDPGADRPFVKYILTGVFGVAIIAAGLALLRARRRAAVRALRYSAASRMPSYHGRSYGAPRRRNRYRL